MATYDVPQPGDRVAVVTGNYTSAERLQEAINSAPVVTVLREHPHEPGVFELSSGELQPSAALQLVQRPDPATLTLETYTVNVRDAKGNDHEAQRVRLAHPAAPAAKGK